MTFSSLFFDFIMMLHKINDAKSKNKYKDSRKTPFLFIKVRFCILIIINQIISLCDNVLKISFDLSDDF